MGQFVVKSYISPFVSMLMLLTSPAQAQSDFFGDVGYTDLRAELGKSLPVAAGVPVMIVEADQKSATGVLAYAPDVDRKSVV